MHSVQTSRGDTVPYFRNPRLLFQAHDPKNTLVSQTLEGSLVLFRDGVLAELDASQIDMHSFWLDVGIRDHVRRTAMKKSPGRFCGKAPAESTMTNWVVEFLKSIGAAKLKAFVPGSSAVTVSVIMLTMTVQHL
ncbi:hypothetical protein FAGAP_962 [Fusarium agapanthi]|uniref:Uncharacterized protein n=1 Tax=Fusarium agapanthi TaxID=1803897 RepID=A0A9P5EBJ4_9HYPO|nr:hypothetical protein FAGAP_962 [Fusarium agapanthi]